MRNRPTHTPTEEVSEQECAGNTHSGARGKRTRILQTSYVETFSSSGSILSILVLYVNKYYFCDI